MIENLVERLAQSKHRWLIVTGVTLLIGLVSALPQVDLLLAERSERTSLQEELTQAEATAARLPDYERKLAEKQEQLGRLRQLVVDESQLGALRTWLVEAARQSGCRVRRIDLAAPTSKPWSGSDNPLTPVAAGQAANQKTLFQLQTRTVTFGVTGSGAEVLALLKAIDADTRLKHANTIELKPTNESDHELQLDVTLWYFALVRNSDVA
jgi:hypothetical protein